MVYGKNGWIIIGYCHGHIAHSSRSDAHEVLANCMQTASHKTIPVANCKELTCNVLHKKIAKNEALLNMSRSQD